MLGSVVRDRGQMWSVRPWSVRLSSVRVTLTDALFCLNPDGSKVETQPLPCFTPSLNSSGSSCFAPSPLSWLHLCLRVPPQMAWATPEQVEFLKGFLPDLEREKKGHGLTTYYTRIWKQFLSKWPTEPSEKERAAAKSEQQLQELADARRKSVSPFFLLVCSTLTTTHLQQITEWFKYRKRTLAAPQAQNLLDLSGKNNRKPIPLQFHHAFSARFHRSDETLQKEIDDLWDRRGEESVIKLLTPFATTNTFTEHLDFHNSAMRWKCSLLTDEQSQEHQDWIDRELADREEKLKQPWKATEKAGADKLSAENQYIQGYVSLPPLMQRTNTGVQLH